MVFIAVFLAMAVGFGTVAFKWGRDEFFALMRRPIRFNRIEQKIYAVRRRRFFAKPGEGDVTWEIPWTAQSIFCVHFKMWSRLDHYHIRHYTVDQQGNVVRAFAIGRGWMGKDSLPGLLAQWNYWREYMAHGPENLPKPSLFISEHETFAETFFSCLYHICGDDGPIVRLLFMPVIAFNTAVRLLAMWSGRDPVWPKDVDLRSAVAATDLFDQPRGDTPVGWDATAAVHKSGAWPWSKSRLDERWNGERDALKNGLLWAEDFAPRCP
jgi:hypothetical protein